MLIAIHLPHPHPLKKVDGDPQLAYAVPNHYNVHFDEMLCTRLLNNLKVQS